MRYAAFLRGINVGGHRIVKMAELRSLLEQRGCSGVKTYIQSGNIIFDRESADMTREGLESLLLSEFGFKISVLLLEAKTLKQILRDFPFDENHPDQKGNQTLFIFLESSRSPLNNESNLLEKFVGSSEILVYSNQGYWMYCPEGYGKTKLTNSLIEKKLKRTATTRNLNTLRTMVRLCEETSDNG